MTSIQAEELKFTPNHPKLLTIDQFNMVLVLSLKAQDQGIRKLCRQMGGWLNPSYPSNGTSSLIAILISVFTRMNLMNSTTLVVLSAKKI
jgi:hypothetical protein